LSEIARIHKVFTDKKASIEDTAAPQKRRYQKQISEKNIDNLTHVL